VIVRSDGQPVFHLVNVIDDLEMGITHVIRGEDHLTNTAKHIALFRAFGVEPPKYAHIPLILNPEGSKMGKRDKGASLMTYAGEGYAPEAVVNYLCLLGWSPKGNRERVPIKEVIELFDLPQILRHNARFDLNKLHWLNGEYIREMSLDRFHELAVHALAHAGIDTNRFELDYVKAALDTCKVKVKLFTEVRTFADFYFLDEVDYKKEAKPEDFAGERKPLLQKLREMLAGLEKFDADTLNNSFKGLAAGTGSGIGLLVHPTRLICTGRTVGPSLYHLMEVLGKERVQARFDRVLGEV
jgi:glutamyl/glutaminyl-tRNA synthetase